MTIPQHLASLWSVWESGSRRRRNRRRPLKQSADSRKFAGEQSHGCADDKQTGTGEDQHHHPHGKQHCRSCDHEQMTDRSGQAVHDGVFTFSMWATDLSVRTCSAAFLTAT